MSKYCIFRLQNIDMKKGTDFRVPYYIYQYIS